MPTTRTGRMISITTPLGEGVLLLQKLEGEEGISQLFNFQLDLVSEKPAIGLESMIGQNVTASVNLSDGRKRYFNGFVSEFTRTGNDAEFTFYRAEMVPWLWFLSQTSDCRIFQNKTVPEVVTDIFQEFGFGDFRNALRGVYERHDVLVQYRETEFHFISRLLEGEGIFYFFEHHQGKHTLVLADHPTAHPTAPKISYQAAGGAGEDVVSRLTLKRAWHPGRYTMSDFNFEVPTADLEVAALSRVEVGGSRAYELFEHPGDYRRKAQGEALARIRMQAIESTSQVVEGASSCQGLAAGHRFALTGHAQRGMNQEYVITHVRHRAGDEAGAGAAGSYRNEFTAIPYSVPFRPLRRTPEPVVRGPETGVVVGPKGEDFAVDQYGRVKVQFHWDRQGKNDENSSGWIRVAQPWAGAERGTMFIPRVGDEVVIDFLHGDLRRPIIIGSLYNGEDQPPHALPAGQTITTIRSSSTKGGGGSNEIRFEDKKGSEEIYFHGQRDSRTVIEHDRNEAIGNNQTIKIGGARSESVGRAQALTIGAGYQVSVGAAMNETVGADRHVQVGGTFTEAIGKELRLQVGTDGKLTLGKNFGVAAGGSISIEANKQLTITTGETVTLKCGGASIVLKKNGDIAISGKTISIKGSGDVVLKGRKILQN